MPAYTLELPDPARTADALASGHVLVFEVDPTAPAVRLNPRQPGLGDALVGQRAVYRRWLGHDPADIPTEAELRTVFAAVLECLDTEPIGAELRAVSRGFRATRHWSGDVVGEWTEDAWSAAERVFTEVVASMEAV